MSPVKILIVEDEFIISEKLAQNLREIGYIILGIMTRGEEVLKSVNSNIPDLIIMDIKLEGELDGIQTAARINRTCSIPIIYLTGLTERNIFERAKITHPASFLTKPYNQNDVNNAIELALCNADQINNPVKNSEKITGNPICIFNDRIFVKDSKNCFNKVDIADIFWIKGEGSYSVIETANGKFTTSHNLKAIENKIQNPALARVHRSFIVNLSRVTQIIGRNNVVLDTAGIDFPVNEGQKNETKSKVENEVKIPIGPEYRDIIPRIIKLI